MTMSAPSPAPSRASATLLPGTASSLRWSRVVSGDARQIEAAAPRAQQRPLEESAECNGHPLDACVDRAAFASRTLRRHEHESPSPRSPPGSACCAGRAHRTSTTAVLAAMHAPMLGHLDPDFHEILLEVVADAARLYRARRTGSCSPSEPPAPSGMEAGIVNLRRAGRHRDRRQSPATSARASRRSRGARGRERGRGRRGVGRARAERAAARRAGRCPERGSSRRTRRDIDRRRAPARGARRARCATATRC